MTEAIKKNRTGALIFCIFVFGLPLLTVFFSKSGLDRYKDFRGEMAFLNDSIRINYDNSALYWDAKLDNEYIKGKLVLASFWNKACQESIEVVIDSLKKVQSQFNREDQKKMLFIVHVDGYNQDSTWALQPYIDKWGIDTSDWKFTMRYNLGNYQLKEDKNCTTVVMLDGRVSKKDDSGDYKRGPLMCSHYNIRDGKAIQQMMKHMAVIMPKKGRKKIVYKADEKLY